MWGYLAAVYVALAALLPVWSYVETRYRRRQCHPGKDDTEVIAPEGATLYASVPLSTEDKRRAMSQIHPCLAPLIGFSESQAVYLGTPAIPDGAPAGHILEWCANAAVALDFLHSRGYTHGKLVRGCLLEHEGRVRLANFAGGVSTAMDDRMNLAILCWSLFTGDAPPIVGGCPPGMPQVVWLAIDDACSRRSVNLVRIFTDASQHCSSFEDGRLLWH